MTALMKRPYWKRLPLMVKSSWLKSGWPPMAAISGVTMLATKAAMTAPKAVAMITATASATTSPLRTNSLKSLRAFFTGPLLDPGARRTRAAYGRPRPPARRSRGRR